MGRKKKDIEKNDGLPQCPNCHALERRSAAAGEEYECDACHCDISGGACFFGCNPCDYSLCNGCYIKVATGEMTLSHPAQDGNVPADVITGQRIDPDIAEFCEHFTIEDRIMLKLNEVMKDRQETFAGDMEKLWEELSHARSPAGLLMAKIRQIQEGSFVGKVRTPKEVQRLIDKFRLDNDAKTKLTGFILSRPESQEKDLYEIERRMETSGNPSATVMMMMVKLHKGERLPEPLRGTPHRDFCDLKEGRGANAGRHHDRGGDRDRGDRDRGDRDRGDRDRDRGDRRRSRSRRRDDR